MGVDGHYIIKCSNSTNDRSCLLPLNVDSLNTIDYTCISDYVKLFK